jgi:NADPH2 dehydrogenase
VLITEAQQAEDVATGKADLVAIARGMLYDPREPWHAAATILAGYPPHEARMIFGNTVWGLR